VVWDPPEIRIVVDGFNSGIGLVWIIGLSLLATSFVLYGATTVVLCGATSLVLYEATTLVLCGATTLILCGTHHPLWLPFCLIGWFGMWFGFGLSSGDNLGQGCEATIWAMWFAWQPLIPSPLMN
jgi:hypothetical protein